MKKQYWHFSNLDKKLGYGDGREIVAGKTLAVPGPIVLCEKGLHASERLIDALTYAPGAYVWAVELSGEVVHGNDKTCATKRKAIWGYDATEVLRAFARRVALDTVTKYWDEKSLGAFPLVSIDYLKTGKESLRSAAGDAAWAARAGDAAWSAAWAAWSAAGDAAWSAAEAAAWSAAEAAARYAAWAAARSAAEADYNQWLTEMILGGRP